MVIDRRNGHNDIAKQLLEKLLPPLERLRDHLANKNLEFEDEMAHQMKFALDREERFVGRKELVDLMWWKINPIRTSLGMIFQVDGFLLDSVSICMPKGPRESGRYVRPAANRSWANRLLHFVKH